MKLVPEDLDLATTRLSEQGLYRATIVTPTPRVPLHRIHSWMLEVRQVLSDEFNCRGRYSDAKPTECMELRYMVRESPMLERAFKAPSLRNVAERPPYMHAGQMATLKQVLAHYNRAPRAPAGKTELHPLDLSERELAQLAAFLDTLSGPLATDPALLRAPAAMK